MEFQSPPAGGFGAGAGAGPGHFGPLEGQQFSVSSDRLAVVSLVLGALSIPATVFCFGGVPLGIAAIIVSRVARNKICAHPDLFHGARSATVGFWLAVSGLALSGLYIAFMALMCLAAR